HAADPPSPTRDSPSTTRDLAMLDDVDSLLEQNLLRRLDGPGDTPRITMLETIREFAHEQLVAAGELDALQPAHASLFLVLAETLMDRLGRPHGTPWEASLER